MQRSEIWLINLDPTIGAEINKTRPAIIVSDDNIGRLPLKVIVPITDWKDRYTLAKWIVRLEPDRDNNLAKVSAADAFQVRSVSQERFMRNLGKISVSKLAEIEDALAIVLRLPSIKVKK